MLFARCESEVPPLQVRHAPACRKRRNGKVGNLVSIYTSIWDSGRFNLLLALQLRLLRAESRLKCHFSCRQGLGEHGFPLQDRLPGFDIFVSLPINGV
jgi:hypothetical protein